MTAYTKESHPREWAIFSSIDTNDDGKVDRDELLAECKSFGRESARDDLANALDQDGDGQVDFAEFCQGFAAIAAIIYVLALGRRGKVVSKAASR